MMYYTTVQVFEATIRYRQLIEKLDLEYGAQLRSSMKLRQSEGKQYDRKLFFPKKIFDPH